MPSRIEFTPTTVVEALHRLEGILAELEAIPGRMKAIGERLPLRPEPFRSLMKAGYLEIDETEDIRSVLTIAERDGINETTISDIRDILTWHREGRPQEPEDQLRRTLQSIDPEVHPRDFLDLVIQIADLHYKTWQASTHTKRRRPLKPRHLLSCLKGWQESLQTALEGLDSFKDLPEYTHLIGLLNTYAMEEKNIEAGRGPTLEAVN